MRMEKNKKPSKEELRQEKQDLRKANSAVNDLIRRANAKGAFISEETVPENPLHLPRKAASHGRN